MSTDALVAQWRWYQIPWNGIVQSARSQVTIEGLTVIEATLNTDVGGGTFPTLQIGTLTLTCGAASASVNVYRGFTPTGGDAGSGTYNGMSGPCFTANNWTPSATYLFTAPAYEWDCQLLIMRHGDPAGAGVFRVYLTVDSYDVATGASLQDTATPSISIAGCWTHRYAATWRILRYRRQDNQDVMSCDIDGLTAPWDVEAVTTGTLFARAAAQTGTPSSATSNIVTATGSETDIGIAPPCEGNLTINPLSGRQFVARRNVDADAGITVFTRTDPDAAWAAVSGTLADASDFLRGGLLGTDAKMRPRLEAMGGLSNGETTLDDGANWSGIGGSERHNFVVAVGKPITSFAVDPLSGQAMAAELEFAGSADRIFVRRYRQNDEVTVITNSRTADETGGTPHPIVYRRPDGRWAVLWFVNDAPREYVSDDGGATWADASPTEDWTAGAGAGYYTAFWQSLSGRQVVAGYHFGDEAIVCLSRASYDADWTGPYTILATGDCVAPYLYQRPDGVWEAGWWHEDAWTLYRADHPGGTWSAV